MEYGQVWQHMLMACAFLIFFASAQSDQDTALYAAYTQEVIGQSLQGPPDIICGYWTSVAAIRYGEPPLAPAACQSGDLSYNAPRYGVRAVDLPIGKYWPITTADVQVWELDAGDLDLEPLNYRQNCPESPVTLPVPALSSGFPFDAYWLVNIAISPYWRDRGTEITFKVTDICSTCAPHQLKIEPGLKAQYFNAPNQPLLWSWTKCWGHPMHPKYYAQSLTPGTALNKHNNPPLKSCWNWVKTAYAAQVEANTRNDPWYSSAPTDPALLAQYAATHDQPPTSLSALV